MDNFICTAVGIFLGAVITLTVEGQKPKAIDVYRGKTTLVYKIVDGIPIDSAVIFKKDINNK